MPSLLLALVALATAEPAAPVAPEPPRFELPALPPLIAGKSMAAETPPATASSTSSPVTAGQPSPATRGPAPDRDKHDQGSTSAPSPKAASTRAPAPTGPKAPTRAPESSVLPPSLTANALRDELRASARRRQDELAAIERERANLQKLAGEIAAARAALQAETARLDEKVKKTESSKTAAPAQTPARPGGKPPAEALAKTLKVMKTEQAAALVARLDRHLAVDLLRQMRPADAGGVLEKMKPETAAELLSAMASGEAGGSR